MTCVDLSSIWLASVEMVDQAKGFGLELCALEFGFPSRFSSRRSDCRFFALQDLLLDLLFKVSSRRSDCRFFALQDLLLDLLFKGPLLIDSFVVGCDWLGVDRKIA